MITEERLKVYQKEVNLQAFLETTFLMPKAGKITGVTTSGITTLQYKINSGTFATPVYPISYSANDTITFTFSYTDPIAVRGNLIIHGKDN